MGRQLETEFQESQCVSSRKMKRASVIRNDQTQEEDSFHTGERHNVRIHSLTTLRRESA